MTKRTTGLIDHIFRPIYIHARAITFTRGVEMAS